MGREDEGSGPLGVGVPRGLFFGFQEVPPDVLVEVLVEMLDDFRKRS